MSALPLKADIEVRLLRAIQIGSVPTSSQVLSTVARSPKASGSRRSEDDPAAFINREPTAEEEQSLIANSPWLGALELAESGDVDQLVELLNSSTPLPDFSRQCIADLLSRRNLAKKRGGQKTPLYRLSEKEAQLFLAATDVRKYQAIWDFDRALNYVADQWEIEPDVLDNYMKGKRGASRRARKR